MANGFLVLFLTTLVVGYLLLAIVLPVTQTKNYASQTSLTALEVKVNMLEAEVNMISLDNLDNTTLVESGTCIFGEDPNLIDYKLYTYSILDLTHYYVEFENGSFDLVSPDVVSTDASCPGGVFTMQQFVKINDCSIDPGRDLSIPSRINQQAILAEDSNALGPTQLSTIELSTSPFVISYYGDGDFGPCAPNTYKLESGDLGGNDIYSFEVTAVFYFNAATPHTLQIGNSGTPLKIPIRSFFEIAKKK